MVKIDNKNKHTFFRIFLVVFLIFTIITALSTYISLKRQREKTIGTLKETSFNQVQMQKYHISLNFSVIESDLIFLSNLNEIKIYKNNEADAEISEIEQEFLEFIKSNNKYDQLRLLNSSGMEIVRANYNEGVPDICPQDCLQDKSDRYYFRESVNIPEGNIYISPLDLNVENGEIEQPLKPMIRLAIPLYSDSGSSEGIIILNYLAQAIINNLKEATALYPGTYSLLNADGFWLFDNNPAQEWGFMYPEKQDIIIQNTAPEAWKRASGTESNQFMLENSLYTTEKINLGVTGNTAAKGDISLLIMNHTPVSEVNADMNYVNCRFIKIFTVAIIIITVLSLFISSIIIQRNQYRADLQKTALYDQLTELPNRILLQERGERTVRHARRYEHFFAVLFIDLDGFKAVNDTFGHSAGDMLLHEAGSILQNSIRETDTAARFGGDEFIVLLSEITSEEDCKIIADKILSSLNIDFTVEQSHLKISGSVGVVVAKPDYPGTFEDLIKAADAEMYKVKESGKNNYRIVSA